MPSQTMKTRIPQQKRSIETKRKLEAAALNLFSQKGFHNTNAKEIAAHAKVAVGSFYAYYKNKKEIFVTIFIKHCEKRITETISKVSVDSIRAKESVYQLIEAMLEANELSPDFHREALAMRYSDPEVETLYRETYGQMRHLFVEHLRPFKNKLRVKDLEAAATVVFGAADETLNAIKTYGAHIDQERTIKALSDMIFRYLFK